MQVRDREVNAYVNDAAYDFEVRQAHEGVGFIFLLPRAASPLVCWYDTHPRLVDVDLSLELFCSEGYKVASLVCALSRSRDAAILNIECSRTNANESPMFFTYPIRLMLNWRLGIVSVCELSRFHPKRPLL